MRGHRTARLQTSRYAGAAAGLVAALLLAGCGSSSGGGGTGAAGDTGTAAAAAAKATGAVALARTDAGTVLVDPQGRTLYAFAADSKRHSACNGSCATHWPPAPARTLPQTRPDGVTATFGTISRSDGSRQLTVDGFPAYTYAGDSGPGQAAGQGLDLDGGLWWVMSASGSWVKGAAASPADNGGGLGY